MADNCRGLFGLIFGHRFEARYNEEETARPMSFETKTFEDVLAGLRATKLCKRTFACSVCRRCGKTAVKPGPLD